MLPITYPPPSSHVFGILSALKILILSLNITTDPYDTRGHQGYLFSFKNNVIKPGAAEATV